MKRLFLLTPFICIFLTHPVLGAEKRMSGPSSYVKAETVAVFKGQQVTGVTVSSNKRIFVNFPKWREGVKNDVVEVLGKNSIRPYPNKRWNSWEIGDKASKDKFISIQSVVVHGTLLYVLDTANPMFKGVIGSPRLFVFDLQSNKLVRIYSFEEGIYKPNSYFNDLRVDDAKRKIYITDSGAAGLVILEVATGKARRALDNHPYTLAETDHLTINGEKWANTVHSDGVALDSNRGVLYIHALTGYTLYGIKTGDLSRHNPKSFKLKTAAPDGMIVGPNGNLYFADLENHKIQYLSSDRKTIRTLIEGEDVKWADTFSIHGCSLYYTNSRIHESGGDISHLDYSLNKIMLPDCMGRGVPGKR